MDLTVDQVRAALTHAMGEYGHPKMGQKWLKPTTVLLLDALVPALSVPASPRPFICMNSMQKEDWRVWVRNHGLRHLAPYDHECLVDLNVMQGAGAPYRVLMTAESEGWSGHVRGLEDDEKWDASDFMWDLYKLLQVPSPIRFFVTLSGADHHDVLERRTAQLLRCYEETSGQADLWAISFPTSSTKKTPVRILHWEPGKHGDPGTRADWWYENLIGGSGE